MSVDLVTLTTAPSEFEANLLAIVLKDHVLRLLYSHPPDLR